MSLAVATSTHLLTDDIIPVLVLCGGGGGGGAPRGLGDHVRASHSASFFTALPLSTAGEVISIHERGRGGGGHPGGRGGWVGAGAGGGCANTSMLPGDAARALREKNTPENFGPDHQRRKSEEAAAAEEGFSR